MTLGRTRAVGLRGIVGFPSTWRSMSRPGCRCSASAAAPTARVRRLRTASRPRPPTPVTRSVAPGHRQPLAGVHTEGRVRVRASPSGSPPSSRARRSLRTSSGTSSTSASWGSTGRCDRFLRVLPSSSRPRARASDSRRPVANAAEARLVPGVRVHPVETLDGRRRYTALTAPSSPRRCRTSRPARRDVARPRPRRGRRTARGSPRPGGRRRGRAPLPRRSARRRQAMLAERLPGLLPELTPCSGHGGHRHRVGARSRRPRAALERRPPFVAPHHGASPVAVIGGGSGRVLRGAVTQAHHGVLFLDGAEFQSSVIQALRQPVESGEVVVSRAAGRHRFPCRFQLVLAANPCPCGFGFGKGIRCRCSSIRLSQYQNRLKGPVLDRVDIQVFVPAPSKAALLGAVGVERRRRTGWWRPSRRQSSGGPARPGGSTVTSGTPPREVS